MKKSFWHRFVTVKKRQCHNSVTLLFLLWHKFVTGKNEKLKTIVDVFLEIF